MGQIVFVPREVDPGEPRVAASPETAKRITGLGFDVVVEAGAGAASRITDDEYAKAGATIGTVAAAARGVVVLRVRRRTQGDV